MRPSTGQYNPIFTMKVPFAFIIVYAIAILAFAAEPLTPQERNALEKKARELTAEWVKQMRSEGWTEYDRAGAKEHVNVMAAKAKSHLEKLRSLEYIAAMRRIDDNLATGHSKGEAEIESISVMFDEFGRPVYGSSIRREVYGSERLLAQASASEALDGITYHRCTAVFQATISRPGSTVSFAFPSEILSSYYHPDGTPYNQLLPWCGSRRGFGGEYGVYPAIDSANQLNRKNREATDKIILRLITPWRFIGITPEQTALVTLADFEAWAADREDKVRGFAAVSKDDRILTYIVQAKNDGGSPYTIREYDVKLGLLLKSSLTFPKRPWESGTTEIAYQEFTDHSGATIVLPTMHRMVGNPDLLPPASDEAPPLTTVQEYRYKYLRINDPALEHPESYTLEELTNRLPLRVALWIPPTDAEREEFEQKGRRCEFWIDARGYIGPRSIVVGPEKNDFSFLFDWEKENRELVEEFGWDIHPSQLIPYTDLARIHDEMLPGDTKADRRRVQEAYELAEAAWESRKGAAVSP